LLDCICIYILVLQNTSHIVMNLYLTRHIGVC
jgi:hypothetical protein